MGTTKCSDGAWGACIGDSIATREVAPSDIHLTGLGAGTACVNDPCDPSIGDAGPYTGCNQFSDTPNGLDAGGFTVTDAGLTPLPSIVSDSGVVCTGLTINPPTSTVTVTSFSPLVTSPASPLLTASYTPSNCYSALASASWSVSPQSQATISGGSLTLVSGIAGPLAVSAYSSGFQAAATVNVVTNVLNTSQAPSGSVAQFNGTPTTNDNIQILYPYANTVFPLSIAAPLVQWNNNGVAASAVKVTIQYPATASPIYTVAGIIAESNPPRFQVDQNGWNYLGSTALGQNALISIQRVVGGVLLKPVTETVHFAPYPLRGSIFYTQYDVDAWTGTLVSLSPFGTNPPAVAVGGSGCPVCHSVSANGQTLITSNWGSANTAINSVNSNGTTTGLGNMWNNPNGYDSRAFAYSAITPDGLYALQGTNFWGNTYVPQQEAPVPPTYSAGLEYEPHNNGSGLTGTYYANTTLTGTPNFTRTDNQVDFNWAAGSPGGTIAAGSHYSVSWAGQIQPIYSQTYTFEVESSDGATLSVNGQQIINKLQAQADTKWQGTIALTAGTKYPLVLQYENVSNTSQVHLRWSSQNHPYQIVAETQLYPTTLPTATTGLLGTYYSQCVGTSCTSTSSSIPFTGTPYSRIDQGLLGQNWNGSSPATGIGADYWSAEWTGQVIVPCAGTYEWCVTSDDGNILWVDGNQMTNQWVLQGQTQSCGTQTETAGKHDIKLDYFQGGGGSYTGLWWASACNGNSGGSWIPASALVPTGDQGTGGYNTPFFSYGDYQTGYGYSILSLSPLSGSCGSGVYSNGGATVSAPPCPTDVTASSSNNWGLGTTGMMVPAFSPDGTKLVFVDGDTTGGAKWRQGLSVFNFNEATETFSNRQNVVNNVAAGLVVRWPAVESDSQSVIYQTNPLTQDDIQLQPSQNYGGMSPTGYSTIPGQLWSVGLPGSTNGSTTTPVPLATLNQGLGGADSNLSYQPTVLPSSIGGYRWAVFTSDRQYGNTLNDPPSATAGTGADQLWVAALTDTPSAGTDRSNPPFWLPNQLLTDNGDRIRNERGYWVLNPCKPSISNLNPPVASTPPTFNPMHQDIGVAGDPSIAGTATAYQTFVIAGGGDDIWNTADAFNYAYVQVTGNFTFQARVTSLAEANSWSKAGVMLRNDLTSGSANAIMELSAASGSSFQWRSTAGASSSNTQNNATYSFPYWVRLVRSGCVGSSCAAATVQGYIAPDGATWTSVGSTTPTIGYTAYLGLAVTAHNNGETTTADFDNAGYSSGTPAFSPTDKDISSGTGDPQYAGSMTQSNGYVITASGNDINATTDEFQYVYMPVSGDFSFHARVVSLAVTSYFAKAGVMLRNDLTTGAAQGLTTILGMEPPEFVWRNTANTYDSYVAEGQGPLPYWVKIARSGTVVTGSISPDGVNWTAIATETPTIASNAYVGLAVTAQNNSTTTTALMDNIAFDTLTPSDPRPGALCADNFDCCGAETNPPTAACTVDVPVQNPVTSHCLLLTSSTCVAVAGTCTSDSDCCGFPNNRCFMGTCTAPAMTTYSPSVFTRDYVATCPAATQPNWHFFDWETITPSNSSIVFSAGTATSEAGLPATVGSTGVVPIGTAMGVPITTWTGTDVGAALKAAGQPNFDNYLRIFVQFNPSSSPMQAPTLTAWQQQYDCVASE